MTLEPNAPRCSERPLPRRSGTQTATMTGSQTFAVPIRSFGDTPAINSRHYGMRFGTRCRVRIADDMLC